MLVTIINDKVNQATSKTLQAHLEDKIKCNIILKHNNSLNIRETRLFLKTWLSQKIGSLNLNTLGYHTKV